MRTALISLAALLLAGCGQQVVLVPPGTPVRLAEPVSAKVGVPDGHGNWPVSNARVQIPAGWYCVPPPSTRPSK
jgi:hypothetical protein